MCFLNAGDTLHDAGTLARVAAVAGKSARESGSDILPAVVYGRTDIVDTEGRFLHPRRLQPPERLTWRSFMHGMLVCHQAFYARTDIAQATRYDLSYRHSADVDWCIRVMKAAAKARLPLVSADAVLADYQQLGHTTANHGASLRERFKVMSRHYGLPATVAMHMWFVIRKIWS